MPYFLGKQYSSSKYSPLVRRLYFGSVGAEIWSSLLLSAYALKLFFFGLHTPVGVDRLIAIILPITVPVFGAITLAHLILLCMPNTRITIIQRKIYSGLELGLWAAVIVAAFLRGQGAAWLGFSISIHAFLLIFALLRKDY